MESSPVRISFPTRAVGRLGSGERAHEAWAEVEIDRDWVAAYRLIPQGGEVVLAELRLLPNEPGRKAGHWSADTLGARAPAPPGGLTADILRAVPIGEHRRLIENSLGEWKATLGKEFFMRRDLGELVEVIAQDVAQRPGHEGRGDPFYARVAALYVARIEEGNRRPIPQIARELGRTPAYVRNVLHDARQRGLLTKTQPGKAGGNLTAKARRLLARKED
jgi:hypothetical protein